MNYIIKITEVHEETTTVRVHTQQQIVVGQETYNVGNGHTFVASSDTDISNYPQNVQDRITAARNAIASL